MHDCLVIGGGPAGLSAAVYMGRFLRTVLVLDAGEGRSSFEQVNDNYLGFPNGIKVKELRELGRQHAARFGAEFVDCRVDRLERDASSGLFSAYTTEGKHEGRTVILCTGVCDIWPEIPNALDYVGKTLFWCIVCDGFRCAGKPIVLIGNDDEAATTACQFLAYTRDISFVTTLGNVECSGLKLRDMESHGIHVLEGESDRVEGTPDQITALWLKDGRRLPAEYLFSLLGCRPNSKLAKDVGVRCLPGGYVIVDEEGYTNVPGFFAAGDISRMHTHQVISAAHEGAESAQTANYYLYAGFQREPEIVPAE